MCFVFFSSRRRHTRCLSGWSSDVCSSDLEAVTALLPRDRVVILKYVVVEDAVAIAGAVDTIAGVVVGEFRENRVLHALEPELGCPVTAKSALARGFKAMAASEAGVEVVEHRGRDEVVIAQTQVFVALDVAAGVKRPEALGAD